MSENSGITPQNPLEEKHPQPFWRFGEDKHLKRV